MTLDDFKGPDGTWVRSIKTDKQYWTRCGRLYLDLMKRTNIAGRTQRLRPTYRGCSSGFASFHEFCEWCQHQVGYDKGFHLDKDLLIKGNKVYSAETCVFLPRDLNNLLAKSDATRGHLPIGVTIERNSVKYRATLKSLGSGSYLGLFTTVESAFSAYKKAKEDFVKEQANKWRDQIDSRAYEALMNYTVEITD